MKIEIRGPTSILDVSVSRNNKRGYCLGRDERGRLVSWLLFRAYEHDPFTTLAPLYEHAQEHHAARVKDMRATDAVWSYEPS